MSIGQVQKNDKSTIVIENMEGNEGVKMTKAQEKVVNEIIAGHFEQEEYFIETFKVWIGSHSTGVFVIYSPMTSKSNPYLQRFKSFSLGKKGAVTRASYKSGTGKEHDIQKIARYYFKAE